MSNLKIPRSSSDVTLDSRGRVYHFIKEHLHQFIPKLQPRKGSIRGSRNAHRSGFEDDISSEKGSALLKRSRSVGPGLVRPVHIHCDNPGENRNTEGWASVFSKTKGIFGHLSLEMRNHITSVDFTSRGSRQKKAGGFDWESFTSASSLNSNSPNSNSSESLNFEEENTSVNLGTFGDNHNEISLSLPHTGLYSVPKRVLDKTLQTSESEDHSSYNGDHSTGVPDKDLGNDYSLNLIDWAATSDTSDQTAEPDTNKQSAGLDTIDRTVTPDILTLSTPFVADSTPYIYAPNHLDPFMNQAPRLELRRPRARGTKSKKPHKLQKKKVLSTSQLQAVRSREVGKGPVVECAQDGGSVEAGVKEPGQPGNIYTCPLRFFGIPSSRKGFKDFDDCLIFKHLIHMQKLKSSPVLYFKWCLWLEDVDCNHLAVAKVLDNEGLLKIINKIIKESCSGDIAFLRQGLHPNRRCGKVALQVEIEIARDFFCELSTKILCEYIYISVPLVVQAPVIGIDLHESPFGYVVIKIWLGPAFKSRYHLLVQVGCLLNCIIFSVSEEFVSIFDTAVYVDEYGQSQPLTKFIHKR